MGPVSHRSRRDFLVECVALMTAGARAFSAPSVARPLPSVSWTCPMHPEVVDNKPGACPICAMTLVRMRLDLVWTCQQHPQVTADRAGKCRVCGRDLVRVIMSVTWVCRLHRKVEQLDPGVCRICRRALVTKYAPRAHGDHNPKHGGLFLMASNNWHIEATHPAPGVFRLYAYDEYTKPFLPPGFSARIIAAERAAVAAANAREINVPFARARGRLYLETRVARLAVPAAIAVKARVQAGDPEYRFDFVFTDFSNDPAARPGVRAGAAGSRVGGVMRPSRPASGPPSYNEIT